MLLVKDAVYFDLFCMRVNLLKLDKQSRETLTHRRPMLSLIHLGH